MNIQLKIIDSRITSDMLRPSTSGSSGIDLRASIHETIKIRPGEVKEINTGICFHIGDPNYMAQIHPRSGLGAKHGLILANSTGIIDSDYQGQIIVALWNRNSNMSDIVTIGPMDRIAQLVFVPVIHPDIELVADFTDMTQRGAGGFGSTDQDLLSYVENNKRSTVNTEHANLICDNGGNEYHKIRNGDLSDLLNQAANCKIVLYAALRPHSAVLKAQHWVNSPKQASRICQSAIVPIVPATANDLLLFQEATVKSYFAADTDDENHPWHDHYFVLDKPQKIGIEQVYYKAESITDEPKVSMVLTVDGGDHGDVVCATNRVESLGHAKHDLSKWKVTKDHKLDYDD